REKGIRWTPFLLLPYWDPTRLTVVDVMHALLEGVVQTHVRSVHSLESEKADKLEKTSLKGKQRAQPKIKSLNEQLYEACLIRENSDGTDDTYLEEGPSSGKILDAEVLLEIRKDTSRTIKPTWVASVPNNFGSKSHGRLKAAEWRILISLYLPISLGRLWGIGGKYHQTCIWYYQNTMMLVAAVLLATSRQTSNCHAKAYTYYMSEYLRGLKRLFPTMKFRDNHHVALHIEEFLILLGPVHSWWMFPFERLIGRLQKITTNGLVGE
ncbi:hypothetical protein M422DRAFT_117437, partial [Sphaerobolus stellatus SS14]